MDPQVFIDIELGQLSAMVKSYKDRGWRMANLCGSSVAGKVELLFSFSLGKELENLRMLIDNGQPVPAISPLYPNAFVFENEACDLYGVEFTGGILDYGGELYSPSIPTPMNPGSLAAQEFLRSTSEPSSNDATSDVPFHDSPKEGGVTSGTTGTSGVEAAIIDEEIADAAGPDVDPADAVAVDAVGANLAAADAVGANAEEEVPRG